VPFLAAKAKPETTGTGIQETVAVFTSVISNPGTGIQVLCG
jgi:hypothetical protein